RRLRGVRVPCDVFPRRHKVDTAPVNAVMDMLRTKAEGQPLVVHSHGYLADVYGQMIARRAHAKHVATRHGHTEPFSGIAGLKMSVYNRADRWALTGADAVIAVSEPLRDGLVEWGVPEKRIHLIPNGLPPSTADNAARRAFRESVTREENATIVAFVGRFMPVKAPLRFLETARILLEDERRQGPLGDGPLHFVLAGDGPMLDECREAARQSGDAERLHFLGFRSDVDAVIGGSDYLVMSSDSEGMPQVLVAAMRDRTVPVCTAVGGIPLILKGFDDCLTQPAAEDLASKLRNLLLNAPAADKIRDGLLARFNDHYTAGAMAQATAEVYREILT
ncbi:glycosyltransferase family 4 protein, partial [bacterium]|nr:glycosyltransferase family 4 protein [bacterium]